MSEDKITPDLPRFTITRDNALVSGEVSYTVSIGNGTNFQATTIRARSLGGQRLLYFAAGTFTSTATTNLLQFYESDNTTLFALGAQFRPPVTQNVVVPIANGAGSALHNGIGVLQVKANGQIDLLPEDDISSSFANINVNGLPQPVTVSYR